MVEGLQFGRVNPYLRCMTVSILGCGWYGLALAKALVADGVRVMGTTTSLDKLEQLSHEGIQPFFVDITAVDQLPAELFLTDVLIIAIPPRARQGGGEEYLKGLQRLVQALQDAPETKVILISSTGVYADQNRVVDETSDPAPNTAAGEILQRAEQLVNETPGKNATILRFGGLVGPGRDPGRFFAGKTDVPNGLAPVNLIHLDDCIGITKAIIDQDLFGATINAVAPHHPTKMAFYSMAAERSGLATPQFIAELNDWKIVGSTVAGKMLPYNYKLDNWYNLT